MDVNLDGGGPTVLIPSMAHSEIEKHNRARITKRRKYRWGPSESKKVLIPGLPAYLDPTALTTEQMDSLAMRVRIEELTHKLVTGQFELGVEERGRSPSPEPIYDGNGVRQNTREIRMREKLLTERQLLIQDAEQICPVFRPPPDYRPMSLKKIRKLHIPVEQYPNYNFIGLIIGPRGKTHRELEAETGCKIAIRGRGANRGGRNAMRQEGDDEPMHVMITADNDKQLQYAVRRVSKFLTPIDEDKNEHKKRQLRELALINGTLRDQTWLAPSVSAEDRTWEPAKVKCDHCGEASHPSIDCPFKGTEIETEYQKQKAKIDKEYMSFLDEVGVDAPPPKQAAADEYASFMADLGGPPPPQQHHHQQHPPPPSQFQPHHQQPQFGGFQPPLFASPGGHQPWQQPPQQQHQQHHQQQQQQFQQQPPPPPPQHHQQYHQPTSRYEPYPTQSQQQQQQQQQRTPLPPQGTSFHQAPPPPRYEEPARVQSTSAPPVRGQMPVPHWQQQQQQQQR